MTLEEAVAITLKSKRKSAGFSQEELAHRCNIDRTYISLIERKKRKPTLNVVFSICEQLNISVSSFIGEIEMLISTTTQ